MTDLGRLVSALGALAGEVADAPLLVGIGWATVDTERTVGGMHGPGDPAFGPPVDEPALGATARVAWLGSVALAVLEPATEGRLAAALARRGEGIACLYLAGRGSSGATRPTALGRPGRLLPHDRPWGPFLVLLDAAGD